jgi:signal transduction histidine kinase
MPKGLRLLLLEDRENDAALLLAELERLGYDVTFTRVETREAMTDALRDGHWDVIISDFSMPQFSAPEALAVCRERGVELPFIIVSGTIGEEEAVDSMRAGAHDFVVKGRLARLGPAIERGLREFQERRALRATEDRLRQAQKMEAIGQLAGGIAHDFNNLLGVIVGHGELLLRKLPPDDRRRTRVESILDAASRGAALTRQLLIFSRQQPVEARPVDLNSVVLGIERMLNRVIGEDIEIATELDENLARVSADPAQLEQVLMNLAINARDAMRRGGRLILETANVELDDGYARSHPDARAGPYAMLAVSDTGHGMDADTLSHIFEPFFTTKEVGKGTGLGLATVYGIVRQSGGHVAVYSEPGKGTTFKVYLPPTRAASAPAATVPRQEVARTGTETVLVVEDDAPLRSVVHQVLEGAGYQVIDGVDPEAALAAARQHAGPVHLVLTDVVLPGLSGPELAARVLAGRPSARVLYMSGYTGTAAGHHAALPPGQAFLQKPFSVDTLLRRVRETLDAPPQRDAPATPERSP